MDYIIKILRTLFFHIDKVVYEGIGNVYDLLLSIARTSIFNSGTIEGFYKKIYALIGIFMLFKISFSLITYILNPDDFSDKEKGFASIIKRVIMSLVMLVLVPYGFQEAYELQTIVLEDNTLAALIFEGVDNDEEATYKIDTAGDKIKFILMYTFFQPNYNEIYEENGDAAISSCAVTYEHESDGSIMAQNGVFVLNEECFGTFNSESMEYDSESGVFASYWKDNEDLYQTYVQGVARQNFYLMFKHDIAMLQIDKSEIYVVDYMAPLSTAVGIAVLWVLLLFCIDVAVRSVKLGFYELIAPIPILSYIDPKTKDGMLSKWFKQVSTTYLSLFMRLLALYLAIFIIYSVAQNGIADVVTGERITDWWVIIFVIIGVLMFAKQLPKILEETLGIKGTGDFTLNPIKKLEDGMIGGKTVGKAAKLGIGTAKGVGTAALVGGAALATGQGFRLGAMGKAIAGGARGEKFGKNFASSYGAGRARKKQLDQMRADGVSPAKVGWTKFTDTFRGETRAEHNKSVAGKMEAVTKTWDDVKGAVTAVDKEAKRLKAVEEGIKQGGVSAFKDDFVRDKKGNIVSDPSTGLPKVYTAAEQYADAIKAAGDALDKRVNAIASGKTAIDDGTKDGSAGGTAATAKIAQLTARMDSLVGEINAEGLTYQDASGHSHTIHVETHDKSGNRVDVKNVAKGVQGEMGAWQMSKGYRDTEDVAKYTGGSKK